MPSSSLRFLERLGAIVVGFYSVCRFEGSGSARNYFG